MRYKEPVRKQTFEFKLVPVNELIPGKFQRDLSTGLKNKLRSSVSHGFVIPVICVETPDGLEVIDGQHRLAALDNPDAKVPVIIVPKEFRERPLHLNIEKGDNIKDKCTKIYNLYIYYFQENPELEERELLPAARFEPSLFTLAFAYQEKGLKSPSLVETVIKKFDHVIDGSLMYAIDLRRFRADKVVELENLVNDIAKEYGFNDFNLKKAVISKSSMALWGRQRNLGLEFEEGMDALMEKIELSDWSGFGD